jgi:capsular exopolysaccharide synthesis family protein
MLPNNMNGNLNHVELNRKREGEGLYEYWQLVWGHRWTIVAVTVSFTLCAAVYFSLLPNLYTGQVKILVEKVDKAPKSNQEMMMTSFSGEEDYYGTQIAILTGSRIGQLVASELGASASGYKLSSHRVRGTRIIVLETKHRDPKIAAAIANKYAQVFMRENMRDDLYVPQQILKWLPAGSEDSSVKEGEPLESRELEKKEFAQSLDYVANDPVIQNLRNEKLSSESKIRELSQQYKSQHPVIKGLRDRLQTLDREINDRTRRVVEKLRANVSGQFQITNIKILEEAVPAARSSEPRRLRGIFIVTAIGFFFGIFIVLLSENLNRKIRAEEDLDDSLGLPFLGYIPFTKELLRNKKALNRRNARAAFPSIVDTTRNVSELADALTNFKTRVLFSMPYQSGKRLAITSAVPDEGKSTVALLLALSLASGGEKILLIDADMRKPFLHRYLNVKGGKGITDYLVGAVSLDEILMSLSGSNLKFIVSGTKTPNPIELLESKRFLDFLEAVSSRFDRIIIDVAPVLFIPDGLIVSRHVDSTIFVCGSGMIHKNVLRTVKEKFEALRRSVLGVVINRADFQYGAYSYKYKYYQSYKTYYAKEQAASV